MALGHPDPAPRASGLAPGGLPGMARSPPWPAPPRDGRHGGARRGRRGGGVPGAGRGGDRAGPRHGAGPGHGATPGHGVAPGHGRGPGRWSGHRPPVRRRGSPPGPTRWGSRPAASRGCGQRAPAASGTSRPSRMRTGGCAAPVPADRRRCGRGGLRDGCRECRTGADHPGRGRLPDRRPCPSGRAADPGAGTAGQPRRLPAARPGERRHPGPGDRAGRDRPVTGLQESLDFFEGRCGGALM